MRVEAQETKFQEPAKPSEGATLMSRSSANSRLETVLEKRRRIVDILGNVNGLPARTQ
jgi:hypothetical protein